MKIFVESYIFESANASFYVKTINKKYKNLIDKLSEADNFQFITENEINKNLCGQHNKCETNAFNFVKARLEEGETNYYPVAGYGFFGDSLFPIDHWWVYDAKNKIHIEITPVRGDTQFKCYAGIIGFDTHDEIKNAQAFHLVDFFSQGHVVGQYVR